ncbi:hypothetical protein Vafri_11427 [Volvox africanus]|nr:hypothetical protein Vafri_11427 [Volvox africanus]
MDWRLGRVRTRIAVHRHRVDRFDLVVESAADVDHAKVAAGMDAQDADYAKVAAGMTARSPSSRRSPSSEAAADALAASGAAGPFLGLVPVQWRGFFEGDWKR